MSGEIDQLPTTTLPIFNLEMPTELPNVDTQLLDPRKTYAAEADWAVKAEDLASRFVTNFARYTDTDLGASLVAAGPKKD